MANPGLAPFPRAAPAMSLTRPTRVRLALVEELAPPDDVDLLVAHAAGDAEAFARLYDRYDRSCFLFIRRILGAAHADAAEDLHQETWIAISNSAAAFDP